jgi:phage repressor protein C with HTH and peptisase S24 domain
LQLLAIKTSHNMRNLLALSHEIAFVSSLDRLLERERVETTEMSAKNGSRDRSCEHATELYSSLQVRPVTQRIVAAIRTGGGHSAVVARSGIASRTLSNLVAGQEPKLQQLVQLAAATGVRLEWLATGEGPMRAEAALALESGAPLLTEDGRPLGAEAPPGPPAMVFIPRYDARASAGRGGPDETGPLVENVAFPAAFLAEQLRRDPRHLALLECIGDSMDPTLHDGDLLLVDTSARHPVTGRIYVCRVNDTLLAKRVQHRLDGVVRLLSDNPRYPPEELRPSDATPLDVLGEVVWRCGKVAP